jgi:hypothetical protein
VSAPSISLVDAYRDEFRRALGEPMRLPLGLAINAVLFAGSWFLLPDAWTTGTLYKVHDGWAFPTILASWMLADTFATNVFAGEASRMLVLLHDPTQLRHVLHAKDLVLWTLVVPACTLVALLAGAFSGHDLRLVAGAVIVAAMPFASLGIAPVVGVLLPYHPIPLAERWRDRRRLGIRNVRWAVLVVLPYVIIGPLTAIAIAPTLGLWLATSGNLTHAPPVWADVLGTLLAATTAIVAWLGGNAFTLRLVQRRGARLERYLRDPSRG